MISPILLRWFFSGAGILQFAILLGAFNGYRILPSIHIYPLLTTLNLCYAVANTSWLLFWTFALLCYPTIFITCLYQFDVVGQVVRRNLRALLWHLHFTDDKIAFFDIPALEIDTEVDGLMVLRGITFSLSTLSFVVHGVEVGIKLSDDLELAISTEEVRVSLFRKIEVGDCFANLKGGDFEMTFRKLDERTKDKDGDAILISDSPLMRAALKYRDMGKAGDSKMREKFTGGHPPQDSLTKEGLSSMTDIVVGNEEAKDRYLKTLRFIEETSLIHQNREIIQGLVQKKENSGETFQENNAKGLRASICSNLHSKSSIPNPPSKSIRVTTLQKLSPPYVRNFLHRLPLLLRLLLSAISYFHPVSISSITATGSGKWLSTTLEDKLFKSFGDENSEMRRLEKTILAWLAKANFALEICNITGVAQVPINPTFDIVTKLVLEDVMVYRTIPGEVDIQQVVSLGGADAEFNIPSFLLPHHEHLLPPLANLIDKEKPKKSVQEADGKIEIAKVKHELSQVSKDETNVKLSAHLRLPAVFSEELLNFITALVKLSKIAELTHEHHEAHGFTEVRKAVKEHIKEDLKRAVVTGAVPEKLVSKLVKKVLTKLEGLTGDVGYAGEIVVKLAPYRDAGKGKAGKLLG